MMMMMMASPSSIPDTHGNSSKTVSSAQALLKETSLCESSEAAASTSVDSTRSCNRTERTSKRVRFDSDPSQKTIPRALKRSRQEPYTTEDAELPTAGTTLREQQQQLIFRLAQKELRLLDRAKRLREQRQRLMEQLQQQHDQEDGKGSASSSVLDLPPLFPPFRKRVVRTTPAETRSSSPIHAETGVSLPPTLSQNCDTRCNPASLVPPVPRTTPRGVVWNDHPSRNRRTPSSIPTASESLNTVETLLAAHLLACNKRNLPLQGSSSTTPTTETSLNVMPGS